MGLRLVVFVLLGTSRCLALEERRKCFAPVMCSVDGGSQHDWLQVFPHPTCHWTEQANSSGVKGEKGDQGLRGEKGSQGEPGIADNTVTNALRKDVISLQTQDDELQKQNAKMNMTIQSMNLTIKSQQAEISGLQTMAAEFTELKEKVNKMESAQEVQNMQRIQANVTDISSRLNALELRVKLLAEYSDWSKIVRGNQIFMYNFYAIPRNYTAAKESCSELGSTLACAGMRIPAVRTSLVVAGWMALYGDTWIGLKNLTTVGHWMWSDGVLSTTENIPWASGQPSQGGMCVNMLELEGKNYLFGNAVCSETKPSLCEKVI